MVQDPARKPTTGSGGGLERLLERWSMALGVRPSLTGEWARIAGRAMLVIAARIGVAAFLRGTPPFAFMLSAVGLVRIYNLVFAGLLLRTAYTACSSWDSPRISLYCFSPGP